MPEIAPLETGAADSVALRRSMRSGKPDYLDGLGREHRVFRLLGPRLLDRIELRGGPAMYPLLRALSMLRALGSDGQRSLPSAAPIGHIEPRWRGKSAREAPGRIGVRPAGSFPHPGSPEFLPVRREGRLNKPFSGPLMRSGERPGTSPSGAGDRLPWPPWRLALRPSPTPGQRCAGSQVPGRAFPEAAAF
jgi:hypothetical protein